MTVTAPTYRWKKALMLVMIAAVIFLAIDRASGAFLRTGLDRYFGLNQPDAVLMIGHSHVVLGIDKAQMEDALGISVSNYARAGAQLEDRIAMARHYASLHSEGPRAIIFGVDNHLFTARGLSSNSHTLFYPHMGDPLIRGLIDGRESDRWAIAQRQISHLARYDDVLLNASLRGWMGNWDNRVAGQFNPDVLAQQAAAGDFRRITIDEQQVAAFTRFLDESEAQGWPVYLTFVPTSSQWQALEPAKAAEVDALLRRLAGERENVTFIDLREPWGDRTEFFVDPIHLNARGSREVTAELTRIIAPLLAQDEAE